MNGIGSIRDVEAIEARGMPDLPPSTYELIQRGASLNPDAPALSFFLTLDEHRRPETWTYRELLARITQTANFFHTLGAHKDTVIAFVLPNLPEAHFVIWGGQATGVVVAINPLLEQAAMASLLEAAGAEILVTLAPFPGVDIWGKIQPLLPGLRFLKHVVAIDLARGGFAGVLPDRLALHDFWKSIAGQDGARLTSARRFSASDASSWFCTGGTTGLPKLAMRTHGNEVSNAWSLSQVTGDEIGPGKVLFCGLPLFHVNAVLVTGLLPFSRGAHVILGGPQGYRTPGIVARFWEIIEHHRVNFFSGVPTLYSSLLQMPIAGRNLSSLRYGLCGAAPMSPEVFREFEEKTGIRVLEGYGLTEATCVSSVNPPDGERRIGSIGLRIPGQRMKSVVLDGRGSFIRDCKDGETGVVVVSGPNVFAGYRNPEHNEGLWIHCGDGERWLNTGDLARRDAEGYFWLTGRKKDLIIRGGHNIDPATIEEPLHRHPAVAIAAAIGRPDAHAGELPVAYVQLKPGAKIAEAELAGYLQREISERAAVPKHVHIVNEIPLTVLGKVHKPSLRRQEMKHAIESALQEAHLPVRAVEMVDDEARGVVARILLDDAGSSEPARHVLGRFTIPFTLVQTTKAS